MARLRQAWRVRNLEVFAASMKVLAEHLARTSADREITPEKFDAGALAQRLKALFAREGARKQCADDVGLPSRHPGRRAR